LPTFIFYCGPQQSNKIALVKHNKLAVFVTHGPSLVRKGYAQVHVLAR
jgi:hypothetical protein